MSITLKLGVIALVLSVISSFIILFMKLSLHKVNNKLEETTNGVKFFKTIENWIELVVIGCPVFYVPTRLIYYVYVAL